MTLAHGIDPVETKSGTETLASRFERDGYAFPMRIMSTEAASARRSG